MGVKHQLILGVVLICSFYMHPGSARESDNSTIRNVTDIVERNINLIEKLPKTDTEQNIVHSDTQENSTNNKQNKTLHDDTDEHHDKNAIKEENTIKQEGNEKHRDDNSRSIDIEKYVSPEFQNNVFTLPNFQDTEKFVDDHFDFKPPTEKTSFSDFDLTTPKSVFFDNKFKEAIQKLEQEFEENQNENEHETDDDNDHEQELRENNDEESDEDDEMQVDKLLDEPKINPNSTLDYKEMKNIIVKNNTEGKTSTSNNVIVEKVKRVNFMSNFSDTKSYGYDSKDNPAETTSPKNLLLTTRKTLNLTKPPNNKNNSHILSNKIETETIKSINLVTSEFPVDTEKLSKETILENQIVPTNNTSSTTTENVNSSNNTTVTTETVATTTFSSDLTITTDNEEIITLEELSTTDKNDVTTTLEPTTAKLVTMELVGGEKLITDITEQEPTSTMLNDATITTITDDATITEEQKKDEITTDNGITQSTTLMTTTEDKLSTTTQEPNTEVVQTTVAKEEITTSNSTKLLNPKLLPVFPDNSTITDAIITTIKPDIPTTSTELPQEKVSTRIQPNTTINPIENTQRTVTPTLTEATTNNEATGDELTEIPVGSTETSVGTESPDDGTKGKVVVIVISSIGAICLVLLALLLYVMRKRQNKFNYKQRCRPVSLDDYSVDNLSAYNSIRRKGGGRQSKRSYGNPAFDDPSVPTHPLNFPALAKFASNSDDIKLEFEDIPQITARTSELPEGCEPKNRYANVIPLPETRVYLQAIDGYPNSDYINANYVTGPKNTKGFYIACQAPMQNTVDDFWRMIWEQQTKVILMMTHFFENGVEKCVDYLPPSEVLDCHRLFGDFQVTLKKRDVKEKYIISSLQLKNMVSNSWREVTHFWYLGWPEKGVPTEANSIIAFLIEARSYMKTSTLDRNALANGTNNLPRTEVNPVVVHCSPGTGRTGVLIACDIAIREFEQTRLVDIPKMVYRIRRDRASAVQTKEQYIFIYKVVSLYATKLTGGALESF